MSDYERKVLKALTDYVAINKYPPTVRELCELTGITSTSVIHSKLKSLAENGYISMKKGLARGIMVKKPITNYDRIRNMSVEELTDFMQKCGWDFPPYCDYRIARECDDNCIKCAKQWLESEVQWE